MEVDWTDGHINKRMKNTHSILCVCVCVCVCVYLMRGKGFEGNIPRHVRIKKLSGKTQNNILLVD